jgi:hypothetical protein
LNCATFSKASRIERGLFDNDDDHEEEVKADYT